MILNSKDLLLFEINEILIIKIDPNVCKRPPSLLNLLNCNCLLALPIECFLHTSQHLILSSCETISPSPLNLYCTNMVHSKSMIFEKSSCQRHFICCLNQSSAKILRTFIFVLRHDIKRRF